MEWSGDEDDNENEQAKSENHEKILASLSVDEPKWNKLEVQRIWQEQQDPFDEWNKK